MNLNYRKLLRAAFPSTTVRSWQMLPESKLISHQVLSFLIIMNTHLTFNELIESLELLKDECKDIYWEENLYKGLEKIISHEYEVYHKFMKSESNYVYASPILNDYVSATLEGLLNILFNEYEYLVKGYFPIYKIQIDADIYEKESVSAIFSEKQELCSVGVSPFSVFPELAPKQPDFGFKNFKSNITNHFKVGDCILNIHTQKKGTIMELISNLCVSVMRENEKDFDYEFITNIEYYLPAYDN